MVHEYPQHEDLVDRRSLMAFLPKGGIGAEIGVADGLFSKVLLEVCEPKALYLIDPWQHIESEAMKDDASNVPQLAQDARYEQVKQWAAEIPEVVVYRHFSLVVANQSMADNYFDWVHLDADHTQAGKDAEAWWPNIKPGGWLTGHDYTMAGEHITVKAQIDEFVAKHGLELFVTRGDNDVFEKNYPSFAVRKPE